MDHIATTTTTTKSLAPDIIEEILLRLPARSIIKFQAVCKQFNHISSQPRFRSAHTGRCRNERSPATSLIVFHGRYHRQFLSLRADTKHSWVTLRIPENFLHGIAILEHICDGLLCFVKNNRYINCKTDMLAHFVFVNPLTGDCSSVLIPLLANNVGVLGFYHHKSSKTYRLLIKVLKPKGGMFGRNVVLTIGCNTLRTVENCTPYEATSTRGGHVVLDGKLYCFGLSDTDVWVFASVLVFDLETELFSSVQLPEGYEYVDGGSMLMEIEGELCLCNVHNVRKHSELRVEMWVLVDRRKGIWIRKRVRTEALVLRSEGEASCYSVVGYVHQVLLVRLGCNDVASTEKEFTFYCSRTNEVDKLCGMLREGEQYSVSRRRYRETLASIDLQLRC